jgi:hypothetical protein
MERVNAAMAARASGWMALERNTGGCVDMGNPESRRNSTFLDVSMRLLVTRGQRELPSRITRLRRLRESALISRVGPQGMFIQSKTIGDMWVASTSTSAAAVQRGRHLVVEHPTLARFREGALCLRGARSWPFSELSFIHTWGFAWCQRKLKKAPSNPTSWPYFPLAARSIVSIKRGQYYEKSGASARDQLNRAGTYRA